MVGLRIIKQMLIAGSKLENQNSKIDDTKNEQ
jgi:hypothetical protein